MVMAIRRLTPTLLVLALLGAPGAAKAVIPSGNLLSNPGTEEGPGAKVYTESFVPAGWYLTSSDGVGPTALEYGAPGGFPSQALGASIGGGRSFFAGGLRSDPTEYISQTIDVSAAAPEIQAGQVQAAVTGCLGGVDVENDFAQLGVAFWGDEPELGFPDPHLIDQFVLMGPTAAERGLVTKLLPQQATGTVPRATDFIVFSFRAFLVSGIYADGYADNLTLHLESVGSPERQATCSPPAVPPPAVPPPAVPPPAVPPPAVPPPAVPPPAEGGSGTRVLPIGLGATRAVLRGGSVLVRLKCLLQQGSCDGRLSLSALGLPRLRARAAAVRLGSKRFSIPARRTGTVGVKLGRRARGRFRAITGRQLRRVRLELTVRIGGDKKSFRVPLKRAR
jgi:hypothetical protein